MLKWKTTKNMKKNTKSKGNSLEKLAALASLANDGDEEKDNDFSNFDTIGLHHNIYCDSNHIYFNNDINDQTSFNLCRELRNMKRKLNNIFNTYETKNKIPIYLHLTTNGGCVHSALNIIDCIQTLKYPVYSIVEGYVASAGTLISVCCDKRYIMPNAYMLIHQLSSGMWGKMAELDDQFENLTKLSEHIFSIYLEKTKIKKKGLEKFLKKDITWNADESLIKGLVDEIWK